MNCPRGSICTESTHQVKTLTAAKEWFNNINQSQLPATINTFTASGGRLMVSVFDCNNNLIHKRG